LGAVSVMPRWQNLPLGLLACQGRHQLLHRVVVGGRRHAVELEQIHVVGLQVPQRIVEAVDHLRGRPQSTLLPDLRLGRDHHAIARQLLDRLADDRLGVVGRRGIEEIDPEVERAAQPLLPPQPRPATLTRRPVLPSVVYCIATLRGCAAAGQRRKR
jgi:hypothetical protein